MNRRFASALASFIIVILVAGPQAQQQAPAFGSPAAVTSRDGALLAAPTTVQLLVGRSNITLILPQLETRRPIMRSISSTRVSSKPKPRPPRWIVRRSFYPRMTRSCSGIGGMKVRSSWITFFGKLFTTRAPFNSPPRRSI